MTQNIPTPSRAPFVIAYAYAMAYGYAMAATQFLSTVAPEPMDFADWYSRAYAAGTVNDVVFAYRYYGNGTYDVCALCSARWHGREPSSPTHDVSCFHYGQAVS